MTRIAATQTFSGICGAAANLRFTENTIRLAGGNILDLSDMRGITYENNTVTGVQDGQIPIRLTRCSDVTIR